MKLHIEQSNEADEVEITIRCGMMDERLAALVRQIQLYTFSVPVQKENQSLTLPLEDVFYFESVDEKTFAYTADDVFTCALRLYELEQTLDKTTFIRVSKACILNTARVQSVSPLLGARLEALLDNREKVLINRHYVPAFKAQFGIL